MLKPATKVIVPAAILMWSFALTVWAQPALDVRSAIDQLEQVTGQRFQGVPDDWSNHHLVFSEPDPASPNYDAVQRDPRYLMQVIRRSGARENANLSPFSAATKSPPPATRQVRIKRDWTMFTGGSANGTPVTVVSMFPAKYSFSTTVQSCNDFAVYSTEQAPSSTQPALVAFHNLYVGGGCGTTVPTVSGSYNTASVPGAVSLTNSVALSLAGDQLAFGNGSNLVLLKLAPGSGTLSAPTAVSTVSASSYRTCTAPCMTTFPLKAADNGASPFVDYANDAIYVGDSSSGFLYKFTGVFLGTPSVPTGWGTATTPGVSVSGSSGALTSPVYDSTSGLVFVADFTGGFLFSVNGTTPSTQVKSAQLSFNGTANSAPLVDSSTELVYYFASADASGGGSSGVLQFHATFTAGTKGSEVKVGTGATGASSIMFAGSFDNTYFTSSGSSGNLFTCGTFGGDITLWRIPISSTGMGTPSAGPALVSATANYCSPITEFDNGTDLLFFSVSNSGTATTGWNCAGKGCVLSFNISSAITTTSTPSASSNLSGSGGSTAMVVDNAVSGKGGEQVYFLPLTNETCAGNGTVGSGTGVCATQASQAALQ